MISDNARKLELIMEEETLLSVLRALAVIQEKRMLEAKSNTPNKKSHSQKLLILYNAINKMRQIGAI
jgi:hypothetical protein